MLKIFNTLTKKKELFSSIYTGKVNLYVCGVTVYDYCHIGHGRTFTVFDMVIRYLKHCQYEVNYIRNITDIDDKIIKKSKQNRESVHSLTKRMIHNMQQDFLSLGLLPPNFEPCATQYIKIIITIIQYLLDYQYAYIASNGDVIFSVTSYKNYGIFSNQLLNNLKINYNVNRVNIKHSEQDFVLWKKSDKLSYISWDSPWGTGRPGWHIECSAINYAHFGKDLDIHGGGIDLLFPHHENERAQSNCFNNSHYGNYWMHVGMLLIKNKKMSKTLNNTLLLNNILKQYNSEVIRYFFLSTHYRSPLYYNEENLKTSHLSLKKLYSTLNKYIYHYKNIKNTLPSSDNFDILFYQAMNDDFNTPKAISILFEISKKINTLIKNNNVHCAKKLIQKLKFLGNTIGLLTQKPSVFLNIDYSLQNTDISYDNNHIISLVQQRDCARRDKLWEKADILRTQLLKLNVYLEDTPHGTVWTKKQS